MSDKRICDVCNKREASRSFKVKMSQKGVWTSDRKRFLPKWSEYEQIDICGKCAERILGMRYIDSSGLPRPPKDR